MKIVRFKFAQTIKTGKKTNCFKIGFYTIQLNENGNWYFRYSVKSGHLLHKVDVFVFKDDKLRCRKSI